MRTEIKTGGPGHPVTFAVSHDKGGIADHIMVSATTGAASMYSLMPPKESRELIRALTAATLEAERAQLHAEALAQLFDGAPA